MRGCLSLPFRLVMLALLIVGGYLAWTNRTELLRRIHSWTAGAGADSLALGDPSQAPAALRKLERLGRRDSVVLSAAELAAILAGESESLLPGALDSIRVAFARNYVEIRARVDTRKVPLSFGPLSGILREHEPVKAGGDLVFRRAGLGEWLVERASVRGIPLPREMLGRLLRPLWGAEQNTVPVPLPAAVGGLRVSAKGLVMYGRP